MTNEQYPYDLSYMEGLIGGTAIDELAWMIGLREGFTDGDFVFRKVSEPRAQWSDGCYDIKPGTTFIAKCTIEPYGEYLLVDPGNGEEDSQIIWEPLPDIGQVQPS